MRAPTSTRDKSYSGTGTIPESDALLPIGHHLLDYARVLYKRRWTAIPVLLIVAGAVTWWAFTATPIYEARTQLLIEVENPNVVTFQEVIEQERATTDYYETQYSILRSRLLARKTMDTLQLWNHPEFGGPTEDRGFSIRDTLASGMSSIVGWVSGGEEKKAAGKGSSRGAASETVAQSIGVDSFLSRLRIEPVRNSRLVDVKFRSASADLSAAAVNGLAQEYVQLLQDFRFQASKDASTWLDQRLAEQGRNVEAAELALQRYREDNDAISVDAQNNIVSQKLTDLSAAVTRANTERIGKETLYNQLQELRAARRPLDTFPAILANPYIQQLKTQIAALQQQEAQLSDRLAERHPEMLKVRSALENAQEKLEAETLKVVQSIETDYRTALAQEQRLAAAVSAQKQELLRQDRRAIKFEALQRDATTDRQIFEGLLQRAKETNISGELKTSNIRIVDVADPPRVPVEPRKMQSMALGLFAGTILAVALAFFFEYLDKRIKSPDELKTLGLPFLGLIPAIGRANPLTGSRRVTLLDEESPHFAEALKSLRTKLLVSSRDGAPRSIVLTSTGPNEGKTSMAAHLAIALARTSREVLLIDADMRQPRLHQIFEMERAPGLSTVLGRTASLADAARRTSVDGLWLLSAGERPGNAAELLASRDFEAALAAARQRFEWTIIDSPPVMAVTDACVIARLVDGVLFVVGSEMVTRQSALTALEELDAVNARFVGTLLNRVKVYRNRFYYSQYYKSSYDQYYGAPVEKPRWWNVRSRLSRFNAGSREAL